MPQGLTIALLMLLCLTQAAHSNISVSEPPRLINKYKDISYALSKFGEVDFRSLRPYKLVIPKDKSGCTQEPTSTKSTDRYSFALFVERGGCTFSKKAYLAKQAGFDLVIAINHEEEPEEQRFIPIADNNKQTFLSPLIVIGYKVGSEFQKIILEKKEDVVLKIDLDTLPVIDKPEVSFWIYPGSRQSYAAFGKLEPFIKRLLKKDAISFKMNIFLPTMGSYSKNIMQPTQTDCYSRGKYCSVGMIDSTRPLTNNTHLIDEGIRQVCMWKHSPSYFWTYSQLYLKHCFSPSNQYEFLDLSDCIDLVKKDIESDKYKKDISKFLYSSDIESCFQGSFTEFEDKQKTEIPLLRDQVPENRRLRAFQVIPALTIEKYIVRGGLKPITMSSSICDAIRSPPREVCNHLYEINQEAEDEYGEKYLDLIIDRRPPSSHDNILGAIVILFLGMVLIFVCAYGAKRILYKGVSRQIGDEIDINVAKYMRMRNDPNNSTVSEV